MTNGSVDVRRGAGSGEGLPRPLALLLAVLVVLAISSVLVIASPVSEAYAQGAPGLPTPGMDTDGDGQDEGSAEEEEGSEDEAESVGACDRTSNEGFTDSFTQLSGVRNSGSNAPASTNWMTCSPDYYYLTYVDTRSLFGKVSDLAEKPAVSVVTGLGKTIFNSFASSVFVWHAKLMALTLSVMNWAFDIDFVQTLEEPVERITNLLGQRVYKPLLGGAWGIALAYAAWKGIARDQVADSITIIIKTAVIGAFGLIIIATPLRVVNWYDYYIDGASSFIFSIAAQVAEGGAGTDLDKPTQCEKNPSDPECRSQQAGDARFGVLSKSIWRMYVDKPWARLQISNSDEGYAEKHYMEILDIKNQDERAEKLCEMAGSSCGDVSGGEEPEDTSGEDTSMEDDSGGEEEEDDSGAGGSTPNPND